MKITLKSIPIQDLVQGYKNSDEEGVVGYFGKLNIRPKYQREFVYKDEQKKAVVDTIFKNFPLNVMYWVKTNDGNFEVLDGQQRTLSICSFYCGEFMTIVNNSLKGYYNLTNDEREQFLNYPLQIYVCEDGTDIERLQWFERINIAGEKLTNQELLNATYAGTWTLDMRKRFSKSNCVAIQLANADSPLVSAVPIKQELMELVIKWISNGNIREYMAKHQNDENSDVEWTYFQNVVAWVRILFPKEYYRNEMKGIEWGELYNKYHNNQYLANELESKVKILMEDDDVTKKKGIYDYVFSGDERKLSIRAFPLSMRRSAYEKQKGICQSCGQYFRIEEMEADHITPWSEGGHTTIDNCQMLCKDCNRKKSNK